MIKKRAFLGNVKKWSIYMALVGLIILTAAGSKDASAAAREALLLCGTRVVPALFPFFVLSDVLTQAGFMMDSGKLLAPFMKKIFGVSGSGGAAFLIGAVSGFPTGAIAIRELYESREITKTEAERLMPFCNNVSPLFIINAVGAGMLGSIKSGLLLYAVHIVSAAAVGIILRFCMGTSINARLPRNFPHKLREPLYKMFSDAVKKSVKTILSVCGFVIFFSVMSELLLGFFAPKGGMVYAFLKAAAEITGGLNEIAALKTDGKILLPVMSAFLGLGGLCVFMQVASAISGSGISMKPYAAGKLLQGAVSFAVCLFAAYKTDVLPNMKNTAGSFVLIPVLLLPCAAFYILKVFGKNKPNR